MASHIRPRSRRPGTAALVALLLGVLAVGAWVPTGAAPASPGRVERETDPRGGHGFVRRSDGSFATIDSRGATATVVAGSDGDGRLVGYTVDRHHRIHGFVRDRSRGVREIDFPGAEGTIVSRINARGQMVGSYTDRPDAPAEGFEHAFLRHENGRYTTIDLPGAVETRAVGINHHGRIVGDYVDRAGTRHGFLRHPDGDAVTIDPPGAAVTIAADIDDQGRIVGTYARGDSFAHGFRRDVDGAFTTIDFSDAADAGDTYVTGINNAGQVAGTYRATREVTFGGFVSDSDGYTRVDVPGAAGPTLIYDVDDRGQVVGLYDRPDRGYVRDERGRFSVFVAPGTATLSVPYGINTRGEIVGTFDDAERNLHGFHRDRHGRFQRIDVPGATQTAAIRINDHGQIVGIYTESETGFVDARGFLLDGGELTTIDVPEATDTRPQDIDDDGIIVGYYIDGGGTLHGFRRDRRGDFATIDVPGAVSTQLLAIDGSGRMVGIYADTDGAIRAFIRETSGAITPIDPPGGTTPPGSGIATGAIPFGTDDAGRIVGSYRDSTFDIYGFLLERGRFTEIRAPGALVESYANDINDNGQIVGMIR